MFNNFNDRIIMKDDLFLSYLHTVPQNLEKAPSTKWSLLGMNPHHTFQRIVSNCTKSIIKSTLFNRPIQITLLYKIPSQMNTVNIPIHTCLNQPLVNATSLTTLFLQWPLQNPCQLPGINDRYISKNPFHWCQHSPLKNKLLNLFHHFKNQHWSQYTPLSNINNEF